MARATRADVAKLAGVSLATVSHVMNGRAEELGFNPQTAKRVEEAAAQLGYIPKAAARAFRYQRTKVIAFFMGEVPESLHLPVFNELLLGAVEAATRADYFVLPVVLPPEQSDLIPQIIRRTLQEVELAGALCEVGDHPFEAFDLLKKSQLPVAWIFPHSLAPQVPECATFGIDEAAGVRELLGQINTSVVKNPVYLRGPGPLTARREPFFELFPHARTVEAESWLSGAGYRALGSCVANDSHPDLVFAANDPLGLGALNAVRDLEIVFPHDIQLFSYGNFDQVQSPLVQLSAIHWPLTELSTLAVESLVDPAGLTPGVRNLPSTARVRSTTLRP
ncbi:hypothetical protein BSR28_01545 [Boudabousia liubingyangii]|uniref:LacI family DNA-binding transcriptional regulator n=1 Tax=Boudabousia liubingyangii TaxID=1921764 RepID=UPI00093EEAA6|nr:LacI family DNA-binding transcriptional regulator [Boudabousia liubingyangii]OKL48413.1 hypothetical protein BSR28_01545 [Boudabousia liubingyangii]